MSALLQRAVSKLITSLPWFTENLRNLKFYKELKVSITFSFKTRKQRKKCYHLSMYHHSQMLLDQVKILFPWFSAILYQIILSFSGLVVRVCGFYFTGTKCIVFIKFRSRFNDTTKFELRTSELTYIQLMWSPMKNILIFLNMLGAESQDLVV